MPMYRVGVLYNLLGQKSSWLENSQEFPFQLHAAHKTTNFGVCFDKMSPYQYAMGWLNRHVYQNMTVRLCFRRPQKTED